MPDDTQQAKFEGWGKVEIMGHQTHIGFVTTEAYGQAVLFRIDQPPMDEREYTLTKPTYAAVKIANGLHSSQWWPAGTKVKRERSVPVSVLVGSVSIYRILPCTQEAAMLAIEQEHPRPLILIEAPAQALAAGAVVDERKFSCCGGTPEAGHDPGCPQDEDEDDDDQNGEDRF